MGKLRPGLAWMLAMLVGLTVAPVAHAVPVKLGGFIGAAAGDLGGRFTEPSDVAVYGGDRDHRGDDKILVVEAGGNRVQRLDRHGNFELMWGKDVIRPGAPGDRGAGYEICRRSVSGTRGCKSALAGAAKGELDTSTSVAVSQSTGHVYVMDQGNLRVQEFDLNGRSVRAWRHGFAGSGNGSIAVGMAPPHHVFAGDPRNRRVLEFEPNGRFVRAWTPNRGVGAWPSHLAVDADGVVYASEATDNADIVRLDSRAARPTSGLLSPLRSGERLTSGWTLGLEVDPTSGDLVVARNPFGPMVVDVVRDPGTEPGTREGSAPMLETVEGLPYVESVNGLGVGFDGSVYIAKSASLSSYDPGTGFERCAAPRGHRPCHGLMVLAAVGRPRATLDRAVRVSETSAALQGEVDPQGVSRYRFQISADGRDWRDVGGPRYVSGASDAPVSAQARNLEPGTLYSVRILLAMRAIDGMEDSVPSNVGFFLTGTAESIAATRPAVAFAPLVHLHSGEDSFPISADRFLERVTVKWKDGDCIVLVNVATGRISSRKTPGAPRVDISRLGRGGRPYRRRALGRDCERRRGPVYSATDLTRPFDRGRRAGRLPIESGFYLDLLSDSRDGDPRFERRGSQRFLSGVPAYYERRRATVEGTSGARLTYWLLYGHSESPGPRGEPVGYHEGDWERVEVLIRPGRRDHRWLPRVVRFHVGDRLRTVPWRDVMRAGSHPVVFSARGSHHPYPRPGRHRPRVLAAGRRVRLRDEAASCVECPRWRTWEHLRPARVQPWYGFGGGWGLSFMGDDTSGPLGPR